MDLALGYLTMLCLPVYVIAQVVALIYWPWKVSAVPLSVMGSAVAFFIFGLAVNSNLAGLFLVILAPFCLLWLGVVLILRRFLPG